MAFVPLEFVVSYGKLEEESEDFVTSLIDAAESYLAGAGVLPDHAASALYYVAVAGIVTHWHENRASVDQTSPTDFNAGVRLIINQLKRDCELVSNLGTSC